MLCSCKGGGGTLQSFLSECRAGSQKHMQLPTLRLLVHLPKLHRNKSQIFNFQNTVQGDSPAFILLHFCEFVRASL